MPTTLIVGANRGIGLGLAQRFVAEGWTVHGTARRPGEAEALGAAGATVHPLDVTDEGSVRDLAGALQGTAIDVLVHNAGIYGPRGYDYDALDFDTWEQVMRVNALAPLRVARALRPHVEAGERRVMAFLSSVMGSIASNTGGNVIYKSSKAALNQAVKGLSQDWAPRGITCLMLHPGWVRTDMGGPSASVAVEDSVAGLYALITGATRRDNGRFITYQGTEIPW